jgi:hypothetical protein
MLWNGFYPVPGGYQAPSGNYGAGGADKKKEKERKRRGGKKERKRKEEKEKKSASERRCAFTSTLIVYLEASL